MEKFSNLFNKFPTTSDEAKQAFADHLTEFEVEKGHFLVREGQICDQLFFVAKGAARSYYTRDNRDITVSFTLDEEFVTAMHSFITRKPSFENIETLERSTIYKISHDDLQACFLKFPELERAYRMILEQYYIVLEEQQIFTKFKSARDRYLELMQYRPKVIQKASVGQIASFLDMTIETLSRIRAKI
ncbi:Crp/Fnr family transcriptional regulator [Algoriphagus halophytocola]|uniref:Crp/Fnr family transcriptional regulator n=1 Tax=Algoriphagus halophytocola TaxID=2991499 RepID=A0ABY6MLH7_9BACT|nr:MULTISPECIES: Crp/Fnr family transcriptional regulator [unclassified Algoriphagus]UZD24600.1 Crp/Fnr family transcriptional regulator [Algoriphagus sp. TR-M5]WBL41968.1 Crp/Fnr family transcriptional regulator [Algoriphagus sp. TR-M9]